MASEEEEATATMPEEATAVPQVQQQNRYAHLVSGNKTHTVIHQQQQQVSYRSTPGEKSKQLAYCVDSSNQTATMSKPPPLGQSGTSVQQQQQQQQRKAGYQSSQYYYSSFSSVDWREQWIIMKDKILERADEPQNQRRLILFIVCCALLLDNMLYMVIVPIIPDYLRSIGSWTTHTENAKWIRLNGTGHNHRPQWQRVGGQVVYEGEDSAVGFLFASKAIVQLFINPFSGAIIDRIGYEIPMMIGLTVMFFSTMVFACGQTYSVLFLARSLQGVGSAFADTSGLAMIADRFTEENERQRALGVALAFISFGCLVAPPFGSVLYQGAGKEVPFIILSLVCLLDGSLLLLVTPPGTFSSLLPSYYNKQQQQVQSQQQQQSLDSESGKTSTTTTKAPMLQRQKSISRRQSMKVASAGEAPKGTPIYVLFRDPCIACCSGALVVANVSLAFLEPTISIWVQNTMPDIEEWQMGMIWLPAFVPHVLGVYSTVKLADKYPRYQWLIAAIGLVLEGVSCLMVPFCSSFWSLIIPISLICFGLALIDTAILPTLGYLVDTRYVSVYGSIYAIADISYSLSYAIGPIIAGGIVEAIGFAALNILIAVVTLGYTPSLMMLRNIHDYEPFEEGDGNNVNNRQQQQQLQRKEAKERAPFGQFGRTPISEEEEEEEEEISGIENSDDGDDDESSAADHHPTNRQQTTAASGKYGSPKWAAAPALKGSRSEQTASKSLSVTIREEPMEANGQQQQQQQKARNPFLSGAQDD